MGTKNRRGLHLARSILPRGHPLPEATWRRRHHHICVLLWLHVAFMPLLAVALGTPITHVIAEAAIPALLGMVAADRRLSRNARAGAATLGLVTFSAILVHITGGLIEAHFHFFVIVVVVSLYQSWQAFGVALAVAQELSGIGSWCWNLGTGVTTWSPQLYCMVGLDPATPASAALFISVLHQPDRDRVRHMIDLATEHEDRLAYECTLVRTDGTERIVTVIGEASYDDGTRQLHGTCQDITARKALWRQVAHDPLHDPLTKLGNRTLSTTACSRPYPSTVVRGHRCRCCTSTSMTSRPSTTASATAWATSC